VQRTGDEDTHATPRPGNELRRCGRARRWSARQRGERGVRGVRPVPGRLEVAAIERHERARGVEDRIRLIRQRPGGTRPEAAVPADGSRRAGRISTGGVVVEA